MLEDNIISIVLSSVLMILLSIVVLLKHEREKVLYVSHIIVVFIETVFMYLYNILIDMADIVLSGVLKYIHTLTSMSNDVVEFKYPTQNKQVCRNVYLRVCENAIKNTQQVNDDKDTLSTNSTDNDMQNNTTNYSNNVEQKVSGDTNIIQSSSGNYDMRNNTTNYSNNVRQKVTGDTNIIQSSSGNYDMQNNTTNYSNNVEQKVSGDTNIIQSSSGNYVNNENKPRQTKICNIKYVRS